MVKCGVIYSSHITMSKEIEPIQLQEKRDRVYQISGQREALINRIGTGKVNALSSWENSLKVGRVRSKVKASVNRLRGELGQLDQELEDYGQARDYLGQISLRQIQLADMGKMVAEGNLPQDVLEVYKQRYQELFSLPERNPALQRGIELAKQEEARRREVEAAATLVKPEEQSMQVVVEPVSAVPAPVEIEKFLLPPGIEIRGKAGQLLRLLKESSPTEPKTPDDLVRQLYREAQNMKVARHNLDALIAYVRKKLTGTGIELVNSAPQDNRPRGQQGSYYLERSGHQPDTSGSQPEDRKGESMERSHLRVKLLGDMIRGTDKEIRLSREEYRLLWLLASNPSNPKPYESLSAKVFGETSVGNARLAQVATSLSAQLKELTGVEGIIDDVGNEELGHLYRIKDAKIVLILNCLPVHPTRLEALRLIFTDNNPDKQKIISTLGLTRGKKRAPVALTPHQAFSALTGAVTRLINRERANIAIDPEVNAYLAMLIYMDDHNLINNKALLADIAQKLEISNNPPRENEVVVFDKTTSSGESEPVEAKPAIAIESFKMPKPELKRNPLEVRDPNVRARINDYLNQILEHLELQQGSSPGMVTRAFPRLKTTSIDTFSGKYGLSVQGKKADQHRFNHAAIATMLYLYDHGDNLKNKLKKQVKNIAKEEYNKRQEENNTS